MVPRRKQRNEGEWSASIVVSLAIRNVNALILPLASY